MQTVLFLVLFAFNYKTHGLKKEKPLLSKVSPKIQNSWFNCDAFHQS